VSRSRVLVTGATGLVGGHLAARLIERGFDVCGLVRSDGAKRKLEARKVFAVRGDLTDPESLARACSGCGAVFHAAALMDDVPTPHEQMLRVNAAGTESIAEAAAEAGASHLVFVSSAVVYGRGPVHGVREEAPLVPHSAYSESKIEAEAILERFAREGTLGVTIFRPYWVYGKHDQRFLPHLRRALALPQIPLVEGGKALQDAIDATDLADAMILAAERGAKGSAIYNASDGVRHTVRQIVETAAQALSISPRFSDVTLEFAREAARSGLLPASSELVEWLCLDHSLDTTRLRHDLGFTPRVPFDAGLRRALIA
jgi:nucleoside-diphosphate-sugar epimerase